MCFRLTESHQMKFSRCVTILWMMWGKKQQQSDLRHGLFWKTLTILWLWVLLKTRLTIYEEIKSDLSTYVCVWDPCLSLEQKPWMSAFEKVSPCGLKSQIRRFNSMQNFQLIQTPWTNLFCMFRTSLNLMGVPAEPRLDHRNVYSCPKTRFAKVHRDNGTATTKTEKGRRKATTETQRSTAHCI